MHQSTYMWTDVSKQPSSYDSDSKWSIGYLKQFALGNSIILVNRDNTLYYLEMLSFTA